MEYGLYEHYVNLFKIIVSLITINKMSEFAFFRFMSLNMLNLEEQQHKDELVSLTEQVLDAKGIECDSKVSKISEEELREILEQVRKLIKKRKMFEEDKNERQLQEEVWISFLRRGQIKSGRLREL
jgi:hypothetical protein